jgi:uncharacterized protein YjiS (DUF1127 family)
VSETGNAEPLLFADQPAERAEIEHEGGKASDLHRSAHAIKAWGGTLARMIAAGLLRRHVRRKLPQRDDRALDALGLTRSDIETFELIERAFARRHA